MITDFNKLAKEIIEKNQYITLSTIGTDGKVWASPVVYAYDKKYCLYFASIPSSRHCQNLSKNNQISVAIFDSHQLCGEGVGIQAEAKVEQISNLKALPAAKICFGRKYPYGNSLVGSIATHFKSFLSKGLYRFYKITLTKVYINNPNIEHDERVEVVI